MDTTAITNQSGTSGLEPLKTDKVMAKPVLLSDERILNGDSGFQHKLLCSGHTFTAGTACSYDCRYCYVEGMMGSKPCVTGVLGGRRFQDVVIRRRDAIKRLRAELRTAGGKLKFKGGVSGKSTTAGKPEVCFGSPLVDIAATKELAQETVEMVRILLEDTDWDLRLLSKSPLIIEIARSLTGEQRKRVIFGLSTGTFDDTLARAIEPNCPSPSRRCETLRQLQDEGYRTFGMLCPILPYHLDEFVANVAEQIRPDRCEHVWAEVLNVRGKSMTRTIEGLQEKKLHKAADAVRAISGPENKKHWEQYARETFLALTKVIPRKDEPTLRFMQYVTKATAAWWHQHVDQGALVLGAAGHKPNDMTEETSHPLQTAMSPDKTISPFTTVAALDGSQLSRMTSSVASLSNAAAQVAKVAADIAQICAELMMRAKANDHSANELNPPNSRPPTRIGPDPKRTAAAKKAWVTIKAKRAAKAAGHSTTGIVAPITNPTGAPKEP